MNLVESSRRLISGSMPVEVWREILKARAGNRNYEVGGYPSIFNKLCGSKQQTLVGQLGQSVDGRIATEAGHSFYINCPEALDHLHCLRALCDGVVIGVSTAICDNPQLTVRRVEGKSPAKIIIDPKGRLPFETKLLHDATVRRIVVTGQNVDINLPDGVEHITVATNGDGVISCGDICHALGEFRNILIEGGAWTLSRFLSEGLLDHLHLMVAPLIIGAGPSGIKLPPIEKLDDAMRPKANWFHLGCDVLLDLDLD
ncbi:RibD family protein [Flexibacterium corallicola]|uniref:RibD family protein n=1 Tax=Flexibacterium corallicola TaxID=3037259 RepID=UPI00286F8CBC|nr:RibD family protein [Pseudovibrio sp. M1P-2-3]